MTDDELDYLTASLDVIIRKFNSLRITYYNLVPKEEEVKKPSIVTIIYDYSNVNYVYNCIMGFVNKDYIAPICIHRLSKLNDVEYDNYSQGAMFILQTPVYNNITIGSKWEMIMGLTGYETGLVIDNSGAAKNFMDTVRDNYYKEIQLK